MEAYLSGPYTFPKPQRGGYKSSGYRFGNNYDASGSDGYGAKSVSGGNAGGGGGCIVPTLTTLCLNTFVEQVYVFGTADNSVLFNDALPHDIRSLLYHRMQVHMYRTLGQYTLRSRRIRNISFESMLLFAGESEQISSLSAQWLLTRLPCTRRFGMYALEPSAAAAVVPSADASETCGGAVDDSSLIGMFETHRERCRERLVRWRMDPTAFLALAAEDYLNGDTTLDTKLYTVETPDASEYVAATSALSHDAAAANGSRENDAPDADADDVAIVGDTDGGSGTSSASGSVVHTPRRRHSIAVDRVHCDWYLAVDSIVVLLPCVAELALLTPGLRIVGIHTQTALLTAVIDMVLEAHRFFDVFAGRFGGAAGPVRARLHTATRDVCRVLARSLPTAFDPCLHGPARAFLTHYCASSVFSSFLISGEMPSPADCRRAILLGTSDARANKLLGVLADAMENASVVHTGWRRKELQLLRQTRAKNSYVQLNVLSLRQPMALDMFATLPHSWLREHRLPTELRQKWIDFKYFALYPNNGELRLVSTMGRATLIFRSAVKKHILYTSTAQMVVLAHMNDVGGGTAVSFEEVRRRSGIDAQPLAEALLLLVRAGVLRTVDRTATTGSSEIPEDKSNGNSNCKGGKSKDQGGVAAVFSITQRDHVAVNTQFRRRRREVDCSAGSVVIEDAVCLCGRPFARSSGMWCHHCRIERADQAKLTLFKHTLVGEIRANGGGDLNVNEARVRVYERTSPVVGSTYQRALFKNAVDSLLASGVIEVRFDRFWLR